MIAPEDIVASVKELAALPSSYARLTVALEAPDANAETIAAAIQLDPALSARVLRHANSAAYSPARPVASLPHAASMIGTTALRNLALATGIVRMFRGVPEHLLSMSSFWKHSVGVASAAQLIATRTGRADPSSAFVAGLLHDVGALLLCLKCPVETRMVLTEADRRRDPQMVVEMDVLGFTHAEVGGLLMQAWGLPEETIQVATCHHEPSGAEPRHQTLVDVVHLADVLVAGLQIGNAGEPVAHPLDDGAWLRSGLRQSQVRELIPLVEQQMGTLAETLAA